MIAAVTASDTAGEADWAKSIIMTIVGGVLVLPIIYLPWY